MKSRISALLLLAAAWSGCDSGNRAKPAFDRDTVATVTKSDTAKTTQAVEPMLPATPGTFSESLTGNGQAYVVYLPKSYREKVTTPLMVFFDPQGNGRVPVHRFAALADAFGCVLAGSNQVRNGLDLESSASMAADLAGTVLKRLGVEHRGLFLCGFSGGAKVALVAPGRMKGVTGVIHCGAGLPDGIPAPALPTYGITGTHDMNYAEVVDFVNRYGNQPMHHLDITEGKHEWPEEAAMRRAFNWCSVIACKAESDCKPDRLKSFVRQIESASGSNIRPVQRMRALRCGRDVLSGLVPVNDWESRMEKLSRDPAYQRSIQEEARSMSTELNRRQFLLDAFRTQDESWWSHVIGDLIQRKSEPMNDRLLGYISLACYSLSRQALGEGNWQEVARLNRIHLQADPENSEANYLSALQFARSAQHDSALVRMKIAVKKGFREPERFASDESFRSCFTAAERERFTEAMRKNQSAW